MALATPHPAATTPTATERPVPHWAERAARALPLLALPVCLWRLPIGFGFLMGMDLPTTTQPLWVTVPYVLILSLLTEAIALLYLGLVRGWGEVVPAWVPVLGGRRVPPYAALIPAGLGALLFCWLVVDWLLTTFGLAGFSDVAYTNGWWHALALTVSGLFVLWAPLLVAVTYAYYDRRCRCRRR